MQSTTKFSKEDFITCVDHLVLTGLGKGFSLVERYECKLKSEAREFKNPSLLDLIPKFKGMVDETNREAPLLSTQAKESLKTMNTRDIKEILDKCNDIKMEIESFKDSEDAKRRELLAPPSSYNFTLTLQWMDSLLGTIKEIIVSRDFKSYGRITPMACARCGGTILPAVTLT